MCTVVFIPYQGHYFMASLRDEHPNRIKANLPVLSVSKQQKYMAPIDPIGGGSWVGINEYGSVIILLNGGYENHTKKPSYAKSRGKIVTELLSVKYIITYWETIDLINMEPFTLIVWSNKLLWHLVWDGSKKYQTNVDSYIPHIWSSSTLYTEIEKNERQVLFNKWINQSSVIDQSSLLDFFTSEENSTESIFIRNNIEIKTHSYSFIEIQSEENIYINYHDLTEGTMDRQSMDTIK
jgi:uncharacterized protein with NRDE domain